MSLLLKALPYFILEEPSVSEEHDLTEDSSCSQSVLQGLCVRVPLAFLAISLGQFDGFVCHSKRQVVPA